MTNVFDRCLHFKFIQRFWLGLAKLLMKCDQFAGLIFEDKVGPKLLNYAIQWLLYKRFWAIFFRIERFYSTIQLFGSSFNDFRVLYDDKTAIDYSRNDLAAKEFHTIEKCEQWQKYIFLSKTYIQF